MDIYAAVTDRIIAQLEAGQIPWHKPWIASGQAISHSTGKPYSLLNQMLLGQSGEYVTFKQAQQEGGHIRKGEKAQIYDPKDSSGLPVINAGEAPFPTAPCISAQNEI